MATSAVTKDYLDKFLANNSSSDRYHIEYKGFLSNHLAHAAIALHDLADTRQHFDDYLEGHYVKRLEPVEGSTSKEQDARQGGGEGPTDLEQLIGKKAFYGKLYRHYQGLMETKYGGSAQKLVKGEFPRLIPGMMCAALHPVISIGYGLRAGSDGVVVEGMAYLHHSYRAPDLGAGGADPSRLGKGDKDILDVIAELRADDELFDFMTRRGGEIAKASTAPSSGFQFKSWALMERGARVAEYLYRVKTPDFDSTAQIFDWMLDQAILVYQGSELINDFFLLHGVTSAWALREVAKVLDDEKVAREAAFYYLLALLVVYLDQGRPAIDPARLRETEGVGSLSWDELTRRALSMPMDSVDEHVFKLVQVCRERSREEPKMETVCKRAALTVMSKPFFS